MSLSDTVSKKADGSTVETLTNTVNDVKQTANSNSLSIRSMQTEIGKKADGSTVTELSQRTSNLEQNLDGFKITVSNTYATNTSLANGLSGKKSNVYASFNGNGNSAEYCYLCQIKINETYINDPIIIEIDQRGMGYSQCHICFAPLNTEDPYLYYIRKTGNPSWYIIKSDTSTWDVYIKKSEAWDRIRVTDYINHVNITVTWKCENASLPSGTTAASQLAALYGVDNTSGGTSGSNNLVTSGALYSTTTIATQTANKFNWLVKSGTSSTDFTLTDRVASLLSEQFNIDALTTFKNSAENGTSTVINGGAIKAKTIKASSIDVDNLFAKDITATGTITGATLKGAKIYSEIGEIAGFTLKDQTLVSEFTQTDISNAVWDFKNEINSKANSEKHFITATRIGHETGLIANKASFGIDGVELESLNHADDYYDKFMHLSTRSLYFGVKSGTPYNGSSTAFKIDSGYSAITSSGEFGIKPSCTINVPTTIRDALRVESDPSDAEKSYVRINNHEVQLHAINSSVVFYLSAYSGSNNKFKLYSTTGNIIDVTDTTAMTITPKITASNGIAEQGYDVVGCTVTKSGNFTCKKYRDGRLIIEFRFKTTSNVSLSNKSETYYSFGPAATFPVEFTDVPSVVYGLGIANSQAPFCNVTFDSVTKTGFGRYIIWTLPTISGYVIPSGSVVSATFTGRWK